MKLNLYERFKIDGSGTSHGRHSMDVLSERFKNVHRTGRQNCKNMQN